MCYGIGLQYIIFSFHGENPFGIMTKVSIKIDLKKVTCLLQLKENIQL